MTELTTSSEGEEDVGPGESLRLGVPPERWRLRVEPYRGGLFKRAIAWLGETILWSLLVGIPIYLSPGLIPLASIALAPLLALPGFLLNVRDGLTIEGSTLVPRGPRASQGSDIDLARVNRIDLRLWGRYVRAIIRIPPDEDRTFLLSKSRGRALEALLRTWAITLKVGDEVHEIRRWLQKSHHNSRLFDPALEPPSFDAGTHPREMIDGLEAWNQSTAPLLEDLDMLRETTETVFDRYRDLQGRHGFEDLQKPPRLSSTDAPGNSPQEALDAWQGETRKWELYADAWEDAADRFVQLQDTLYQVKTQRVDPEGHAPRLVAWPSSAAAQPLGIAHRTLRTWCEEAERLEETFLDLIDWRKRVDQASESLETHDLELSILEPPVIKVPDAPVRSLQRYTQGLSDKVEIWEAYVPIVSKIADHASQLLAKLRANHSDLRLPIKGVEEQLLASLEPIQEEGLDPRTLDRLSDRRDQLGGLNDDLPGKAAQLQADLQAIFEEHEGLPGGEPLVPPPVIEFSDLTLEGVFHALEQYQARATRWTNYLEVRKQAAERWEDRNELIETLHEQGHDPDQTLVNVLAWPDIDAEDPTARSKQLDAWVTQTTRFLDQLEGVMDSTKELDQVYNDLETPGIPPPLRPARLQLPAADPEGLTSGLDQFAASAERWETYSAARRAAIDCWEKVTTVVGELAGTPHDPEKALETLLTWPDTPDEMEAAQEQLERWRSTLEKNVEHLEEVLETSHSLEETYADLEKLAPWASPQEPPRLETQEFAGSSTPDLTALAASFRERTTLWEAYAKETQACLALEEELAGLIEPLHEEERPHDPEQVLHTGRESLEEAIQLDPSEALEALGDWKETWQRARERLADVQDKLSEVQAVRKELLAAAHQLDQGWAYEQHTPPVFAPAATDPKALDEAAVDWSASVKTWHQKAGDLLLVEAARAELASTLAALITLRENWNIETVPWKPVPEALDEALQSLAEQGLLEPLKELQGKLEAILETAEEGRAELRELSDQRQQALEAIQDLSETHGKPTAWTARIEALEAPSQATPDRFKEHVAEVRRTRRQVEAIDSSYEKLERVGPQLETTIRVLEVEHPIPHWESDRETALRSLDLEGLQGLVQEVAKAQTAVLRAEADDMDKHRKRTRSMVESLTEVMGSQLSEGLCTEVIESAEEAIEILDREDPPIERLQAYIASMTEAETALGKIQTLFHTEAEHWRRELAASQGWSTAQQRNRLNLQLDEFERAIGQRAFDQALTLRHHIHHGLTRALFQNDLEFGLVYEIAGEIRSDNLRVAEEEELL